MAPDLIASFPLTVLRPGMTLVFRAVDAATEANVANVVVSDVSLYGNVADAGDAAGPVTDVIPVFPYGENV
jgi:hypothetical protein